MVWIVAVAKAWVGLALWSGRELGLGAGLRAGNKRITKSKEARLSPGRSQEESRKSTGRAQERAQEEPQQEARKAQEERGQTSVGRASEEQTIGQFPYRKSSSAPEVPA